MSFIHHEVNSLQITHCLTFPINFLGIRKPEHCSSWIHIQNNHKTECFLSSWTTFLSLLKTNWGLVYIIFLKSGFQICLIDFLPHDPSCFPTWYFSLCVRHYEFYFVGYWIFLYSYEYSWAVRLLGNSLFLLDNVFKICYVGLEQWSV